MARDGARKRIRDWLAAQIAEDEPHDRIALESACASELRRDPAFVEVFLDQYLIYIVRQTGAHLFDRLPRYRHNVGTRLMTTDQLREEIATEATPWARWIGRGEKGAAIPLLQMTRNDLLLAVDEKKRNGDTAYKDAAFFKAIADTLDGSQEVGDVWRAADLEALYERISLRIKAEVVLMPALNGKVTDS